MSGPIDFYFDFISPFGYLAAGPIEALGADFGRPVRWRPILLGVTVMQVMGLKPVMETPLKADYMEIDRPRMAKLLGVPLTIPNLQGVNSLAAGRAFYWLDRSDPALAKALARRLLERLWADGLDITDPETVTAEAAGLGADADGLRAALAGREARALLRDAVEAAVARKVFGSPFFIVDDQPIWGVDRMWMVRHWLAHGSWDRADDTPI